MSVFLGFLKLQLRRRCKTSHQVQLCRRCKTSRQVQRRHDAKREKKRSHYCLTKVSNFPETGGAGAGASVVVTLPQPGWPQPWRQAVPLPLPASTAIRARTPPPPQQQQKPPPPARARPKMRHQGGPSAQRAIQHVDDVKIRAQAHRHACCHELCTCSQPGRAAERRTCLLCQQCRRPHPHRHGCACCAPRAAADSRLCKAKVVPGGKAATTCGVSDVLPIETGMHT